jgi:hypothetical protein
LQFGERESFAWCVKNAFSHPHNQDRVVQEWMETPEVGKFLLATTDANLKEDCPAELKVLFRLAFTEGADGGRCRVTIAAPMLIVRF